MTVAVLGANGVYARHLIPRLLAEGHRVLALARRPEAATVAAACGAEVRPADIFDREQLAAALRGADVGVNLATTLPGPSGRGDYAENDRLRRDGVPVWLDACRDAGVARVLQQSIALVHSGAGADGGSASVRPEEEWADEDTPARVDDTVAGRAIAAAVDMEATVRDSGLDWSILRGGLFYGPGTGTDDDWYQRARDGQLRLPEDGRGYVSLVHVADMAAATAVAIDRWPSGRALIVADDQPVRWVEVLGFVAAAVGAAPPRPGGRAGLPSFRVRNDRARDSLGWAPFHPSYHSGLIR
jgi:nucleoside-diphosphate-sugar epimerase